MRAIRDRRRVPGERVRARGVRGTNEAPVDPELDGRHGDIVRSGSLEGDRRGDGGVVRRRCHGHRGRCRVLEIGRSLDGRRLGRNISGGVIRSDGIGICRQLGEAKVGERGGARGRDLRAVTVYLISRDAHVVGGSDPRKGNRGSRDGADREACGNGGRCCVGVRHCDGNILRVRVARRIRRLIRSATDRNGDRRDRDVVRSGAANSDGSLDGGVV